MKKNLITFTLLAFIAAFACSQVAFPVRPIIDPCRNKNCGIAETCVKGICVPLYPPDPCRLIQCPFGFKCFNGNCIPTNVNPIDKCRWINCPPGQRCKEGRCYSFDPCSFRRCPVGEHCQNGVCLPNITTDPCLGIVCRYPNQFCLKGQCVYPIDRLPCSKIRCKQGQHCENGICVQDVVQDPCWLAKCFNGYHCINGGCVPNDPCHLILCNKGQHCEGGRCIPNIVLDPCQWTQCQDGFRCVNGGCISNDKCYNIKCQKGRYCFNGRCIRIYKPPRYQCTRNENCGSGYKCKFGKCIEKCSDIVCPKDFICVQGKCEKIGCDRIICPTGMYCSNGKCVPDLNVCPAGSSYQTTTCMNPRPTQQNCPTLNYFRQPDPLFCGVRADGSRVDFAEQCSTCKDKSIIYYFSTPCSNAPFICDADEVCNDYYCSGFCENDGDCPQDWQTCIQGKCIDNCVRIRCLYGSCKFGECEQRPKDDHHHA